MAILSQYRLKTVLHYTAHQAQWVPEHSLSLNVSLQNSAERLRKYCRIRKHKHPKHGRHRTQPWKTHKHNYSHRKIEKTWHEVYLIKLPADFSSHINLTMKTGSNLLPVQNNQQLSKGRNDNRLWDIWIHNVLERLTSQIITVLVFPVCVIWCCIRKVHT